MADEMEKQEVHTVSICTALPGRLDLAHLKTAKTVTADLPISPEDLLDYADVGYAPHYRVNGGPALFKKGEVKEWIAEHLTKWCSGKTPPIQLVVHTPAKADQVPAALASLALQLIDAGCPLPTGVYFLCRGPGKTVVYVGQSMNPLSRIGNHSDKNFDRIFLLPVPPNLLDSVEGAFIRCLKPEYNTNEKGKLVGLRGNRKFDKMILDRLGFALGEEKE